jgi:methylenetetrahydrofolate reductase (NADH)
MSSRASATAAEPALASLLRAASLEVSPRDPLAGPALADLVAPGTRVFVNHAPGDSAEGIAAAASRLARAGFVPVPHVAARRLSSFGALNEFLRRLAGEAGVDTALAIAGDLDRAKGPFESSFEMLATGLFERHGIRRIGLAGYPEPHPRIGTRALEDALRLKLGLARQAGLEPFIVTQFAFEAAPIRAWIASRRADGVTAPIIVGLAGPASIAALAKFAVRCGVGASLRALAGNRPALPRLLAEAGPDALIADLAAAAADLAGFHFFTFTGVRRTARWLAAADPVTERTRNTMGQTKDAGR